MLWSSELQFYNFLDIPLSLDMNTFMRALFTTLGFCDQASIAIRSGLLAVVLAMAGAICTATHANTPIPVDLELSIDVKNEKGKKAVFNVVRMRAAEQGFMCKDAPMKMVGHEFLILDCVKRSKYSSAVHSIVAGDNLGLAFFSINGYFGGSPEPVSSLVATIEQDVKKIGGVTVRYGTDTSVMAREEEARREFSRIAMDNFRQKCANASPSQPQNPACPPRK